MKVGDRVAFEGRQGTVEGFMPGGMVDVRFDDAKQRVERRDQSLLGAVAQSNPARQNPSPVARKNPETFDVSEKYKSAGSQNVVAGALKVPGLLRLLREMQIDPIEIKSMDQLFRSMENSAAFFPTKQDAIRRQLTNLAKKFMSDSVKERYGVTVAAKSGPRATLKEERQRQIEQAVSQKRRRDVESDIDPRRRTQPKSIAERLGYNKGGFFTLPDPLRFNQDDPSFCGNPIDGTAYYLVVPTQRIIRSRYIRWDEMIPLIQTLDLTLKADQQLGVKYQQYDVTGNYTVAKYGQLVDEQGNWIAGSGPVSGGVAQAVKATEQLAKLHNIEDGAGRTFGELYMGLQNKSRQQLIIGKVDQLIRELRPDDRKILEALVAQLTEAQQKGTPAAPEDIIQFLDKKFEFSREEQRRLNQDTRPSLFASLGDGGRKNFATVLSSLAKEGKSSNELKTYVLEFVSRRYVPQLTRNPNPVQLKLLMEDALREDQGESRWWPEKQDQKRATTPSDEDFYTVDEFGRKVYYKTTSVKRKGLEFINAISPYSFHEYVTTAPLAPLSEALQSARPKIGRIGGYAERFSPLTAEMLIRSGMVSVTMPDLEDGKLRTRIITDPSINIPKGSVVRTSFTYKAYNPFFSWVGQRERIMPESMIVTNQKGEKERIAACISKTQRKQLMMVDRLHRQISRLREDLGFLRWILAKVGQGGAAFKDFMSEITTTEDQLFANKLKYTFGSTQQLDTMVEKVCSAILRVHDTYIELIAEEPELSDGMAILEMLVEEYSMTGSVDMYPLTGAGASETFVTLTRIMIESGIAQVILLGRRMTGAGDLSLPRSYAGTRGRRTPTVVDWLCSETLNSSITPMGQSALRFLAARLASKKGDIPTEVQAHTASGEVEVYVPLPLQKIDVNDTPHPMVDALPFMRKSFITSLTTNTTGLSLSELAGSETPMTAEEERIQKALSGGSLQHGLSVPMSEYMKDNPRKARQNSFMTQRELYQAHRLRVDASTARQTYLALATWLDADHQAADALARQLPQYHAPIRLGPKQTEAQRVQDAKSQIRTMLGEGTGYTALARSYLAFEFVGLASFMDPSTFVKSFYVATNLGYDPGKPRKESLDVCMAKDPAQTITRISWLKSDFNEEFIKDTKETYQGFSSERVRDENWFLYGLLGDFYIDTVWFGRGSPEAQAAKAINLLMLEKLFQLANGPHLVGLMNRDLELLTAQEAKFQNNAFGRDYEGPMRAFLENLKRQGQIEFKATEEETESGNVARLHSLQDALDFLARAYAIYNRSYSVQTAKNNPESVQGFNVRAQYLAPEGEAVFEYKFLTPDLADRQQIIAQLRGMNQPAPKPEQVSISYSELPPGGETEEERRQVLDAWLRNRMKGRTAAVIGYLPANPATPTADDQLFRSVAQAQGLQINFFRPALIPLRQIQRPAFGKEPGDAWRVPPSEDEGESLISREERQKAKQVAEEVRGRRVPLSGTIDGISIPSPREDLFEFLQTLLSRCPFVSLKTSPNKKVWSALYNKGAEEFNAKLKELALQLIQAKQQPSFDFAAAHQVPLSALVDAYERMYPLYQTKESLRNQIRAVDEKQYQSDYERWQEALDRWNRASEEYEEETGQEYPYPPPKEPQRATDAEIEEMVRQRKLPASVQRALRGKDRRALPARIVGASAAKAADATSDEQLPLTQALRKLDLLKRSFFGESYEASLRTLSDRDVNYVVLKTYNPILFQLTRKLWRATDEASGGVLFPYPEFLKAVDETGRYGVALQQLLTATATSDDSEQIADKLEYELSDAFGVSNGVYQASLKDIVRRLVPRKKGQGGRQAKAAWGTYEVFSLLWTLGMTLDEAREDEISFVLDPMEYIKALKTKFKNNAAKMENPKVVAQDFGKSPDDRVADKVLSYAQQVGQKLREPIDPQDTNLTGIDAEIQAFLNDAVEAAWSRLEVTSPEAAQTPDAKILDVAKGRVPVRLAHMAEYTEPNLKGQALTIQMAKKDYKPKIRQLLPLHQTLVAPQGNQISLSFYNPEDYYRALAVLESEKIQIRGEILHAFDWPQGVMPAKPVRDLLHFPELKGKLDGEIYSLDLEPVEQKFEYSPAITKKLVAVAKSLPLGAVESQKTGIPGFSTMGSEPTIQLPRKGARIVAGNLQTITGRPPEFPKTSTWFEQAQREQSIAQSEKRLKREEIDRGRGRSVGTVIEAPSVWERLAKKKKLKVMSPAETKAQAVKPVMIQSSRGPKTLKPDMIVEILRGEYVGQTGVVFDFYGEEVDLRLPDGTETHLPVSALRLSKQRQ